MKLVAPPYSMAALLKPYMSSVSKPADILGSANDDGVILLSRLLAEEVSPHCRLGTSR